MRVKNKASQTKSKNTKKRKKLRKRLTATAAVILSGALTVAVTDLLVKAPHVASNAIKAGSTPLTVTVKHETSNLCSLWFIKKNLQDISAPPPKGQALDSWVRHENAADVGRTDVIMTIQGNASKPTILTSLNFYVTKRDPPPRGPVIATHCEGDAVPGRFAMVDLDKQPAEFTAFTEPDPTIPKTSRKNQLIHFPYSVSSADSEVFIITASTQHCGCSWYAKLSWSSQGKSGEKTIDDNGRPFWTDAATEGQPRAKYDEGNHRWRLCASSEELCELDSTKPY